MLFAEQVVTVIAQYMLQANVLRSAYNNIVKLRAITGKKKVESEHGGFLR